jgi:ferrous iron transport protein A
MGVSEIRLSDLNIGESAVVESFTDEAIQLKMLEMGCLPGEIISVLRVAPLGDPMAVEVAGSVISIRLDEAGQILVNNLK